MHKLNLVSIRNYSKKSYANLMKNKKDKINYNFNPTAPNEIWVSDTTYLDVNNRRYFLCAVMDLFSRKIIAYKLSAKHSTNLISATFDIAFNTRKPIELIFHSDRGSQYTSKSFMLKLKHLEVSQSFSPVASPTKNGVMESFFSNFKREEFYRTNYKSVKHLKIIL